MYLSIKLVATQPSLASFPPELLDHLISYISNPSDLLSLALTSSTFRAIVIPFHLHYRTIRCVTDDSEMWNHLLESQRRLQHVHALQLYRSTSSSSVVLSNCLPRILRNEGEAPPAASSLTLSAISQMTHLKSLAWLRRDSEYFWPLGFSNSRYVERAEFDNLAEEFWDTVLQHCHELQEVVARSFYGCCDCAAQRGGPRTLTKLFNLRGLTSLSYEFYYCTRDGHSEFNSSPLISFLASNPELQLLRVLAPFMAPGGEQRVNLQELFHLRLPSLRTFSLAGKIETIPAPLLIGFFDANPLLEYVHLGQIVRIEMNPTASPTHLLPLLKHISAYQLEVLTWFWGDLPDGTVRPLVSMGVSCPLYGGSGYISFLDKMSTAVGKGLNALSMCFWVDRPLVHWADLIAHIGSTCPNLRRLNIDRFPASKDVSLIGAPIHSPQNSPDYWSGFSALGKLELLTVPKGFFTHIATGTKETDWKPRLDRDAMLELTRTCPSLRLINGRINVHFREHIGLIYLRPATGTAEQCKVTEYSNKEGSTFAVELSDEGQSTDFSWQLYLANTNYSRTETGEDLWRIFLPHYDNLRFTH
ncbi:hypothetical protein FRC01_005786 [Tulasnella sp. 417]|nr:hypothetical protein FRC01_005786 [Tulasnella sp. 417]